MLWSVRRIKLTGCALALMIFADPSMRPARSQSVIDLSRYRLTFSEEFDRLDVSAWGPGTKWIAHTPWNGDFGDARFAEPTADFPFTVKDGVLRIEAKQDRDGHWSSGLLASTDGAGTGFAQRFGYFEMRAKLPPGPGLWPAFWLMANKHPDASAELDVIEHYGAFPDMYESVVHVWAKTPKAVPLATTLRHTVPAGLLYEDFHRFGASVDPDVIRLYLDGVEIAQTPTPPPFHEPLFILLNLAMGAGWPIKDTPNPSYMFVDYVRAYERVSPDTAASAQH